MSAKKFWQYDYTPHRDTYTLCLEAVLDGFSAPARVFGYRPLSKQCTDFDSIAYAWQSVGIAMNEAFESEPGVHLDGTQKQKSLAIAGSRWAA
ncbi:MAG: hypothetical protein ABL893_20550 [Hyphomicrobium sp.]|nr:hypothetical protein [Hyphomicrobium sp.]